MILATNLRGWLISKELLGYLIVNAILFLVILLRLMISSEARESWRKYFLQK
jgi:hypothetical protein